MTAYAATRRGRESWAPLRLLLDGLRPSSDEQRDWPRPPC